MTLYISILVILLIIYIFVKNQKPKIQQSAKYDTAFTKDTSPLKRKPMSSVKKTNFIPYKIVENDNALRTIIDDYERREKEAIQDFETRLGKALPNDVKWSILQDLAIEAIENKNAKLCVNVEYQRGLLLQKEKKYKQAISHYSMGLYYLMNFYPHKFNPFPHIIDYVTNDIQVIEMAQEKFINKIKLCVKYSNISLDDLFESVQRITTVTVLKKVSPIELLQEITLATKSFYMPDDEEEEISIGDKRQNMYKEFELEDVITGYSISSPGHDIDMNIEALRNAFKEYKTWDDVPDNLKDFALPITDFSKELDLENNKNPNIGYKIFNIAGNLGNKATKIEFNNFLLTIFEYLIGKYQDLPLDEKLNNIDKDTNSPSMIEIRKKIFGNELPSKVISVYELTKIDGIGKVTAEKLYDNKVRNLDELLIISDDKLKKICNKCIKIKHILLNKS